MRGRLVSRTALYRRHPAAGARDSNTCGASSTHLDCHSNNAVLAGAGMAAGASPNIGQPAWLERLDLAIGDNLGFRSATRPSPRAPACAA
jgi:hypothetical protein